MSYPQWVRIPEVAPAHFFFEALAYAVGFALYRRKRKREGDILAQPDRTSVIVATILGAAIGSKVLGWLEDPAYLAHGFAAIWPGGKTIVGGLLGGTIAVEFEKRRLGIVARTGDLFAIPITIGIAIGRIGCFFGGIDDHTYGSPTRVPWAVDFGDGTPRHPTQLYEIVFLLILAGVLNRLRKLRLASGDLYRIFLFSYLFWRFAIDFLKPEPVFAGLSSIQWCCLAGIFWYSRDIARVFSNRAGAYVNG